MNDINFAEPVRLFVYGTMKYGQRNHERLASEFDTKFVGYSQTARNEYSMKSKTCFGGIAPVVSKGGANAILGEIYEIHQDLLDYIDIMEGCPSVYHRVVVSLADGSSAYMYLGTDPAQASSDVGITTGAGYALGFHE